MSPAPGARDGAQSALMIGQDSKDSEALFLAADCRQCVVDADIVAGTGLTGGAKLSIDVPRLILAVRRLQQEHLCVILVSRYDLAPLLADALLQTVAGSQLMCVRAIWEDNVLDLLRVAREFQCPFVTNADIVGYIGTWKLPASLHQWLQSVCHNLHIRFKHTADGSVDFQMPQRLRERIGSATPRKPQRQTSMPVSSSFACRMDPTAGSTVSPVTSSTSWLAEDSTAVPGSTSKSGPGLVSPTAAWLAGGSLASSAAPSCAAQSSQVGSAHSVAASWRRTPPAPVATSVDSSESASFGAANLASTPIRLSQPKRKGKCTGAASVMPPPRETLFAPTELPGDVQPVPLRSANSVASSWRRTPCVAPSTDYSDALDWGSTNLALPPRVFLQPERKGSSHADSGIVEPPSTQSAHNMPLSITPVSWGGGTWREVPFEGFELPPLRVLRLPKAIIRPAVGKSKGVCENDGEEMLICVEADSTKLSDGLFPYAMELSGYVASPDQIREDTGSDELKSVRQALEQQGLGEWCSQGNFVVISVVSGRYRGLSAVGLGTSKKARARAARLALAATWRTKIPTRNGTAIDDSIGDGVFGSLVEKVRQLLEASALTPIANSDDTPGTRCNLSFPNGGLDVPLPLPLSIGSQFSDQSYGQEKLQGRLVEVQASYQPEGVGYIALRRGDKLKILHSKKEAPGLNDQFSSYVFGKLLDTDEHSADESGFVGWFPLDVVKFI